MCNYDVSYEHYKKYTKCKINNESKTIEFIREMDNFNIHIWRTVNIIPSSYDYIKPDKRFNFIFKFEPNKKFIPKIKTDCITGYEFNNVLIIKKFIDNCEPKNWYERWIYCRLLQFYLENTFNRTDREKLELLCLFEFYHRIRDYE